MESVSKLVNAVKDSPELKAWIALYQFLVDGQDQKWKTWQNYCKNIPAKSMLKLQKDFLKHCNDSNFLKLYRPIVKNGKVIEMFEPLAIAFCQKKELILVDLID